jgi:hypothetical protein
MCSPRRHKPKPSAHVAEDGNVSSGRFASVLGCMMTLMSVAPKIGLWVTTCPDKSKSIASSYSEHAKWICQKSVEEAKPDMIHPRMNVSWVGPLQN